MNSWEGTKPGLWTGFMDWTIDWSMDWSMDWIMDSIWTGQQNLQINLLFPGLPTAQYLIASSLVSRIRIIQISYAHFGIGVSV